MGEATPWSDIPLGKVWDSCQASQDKRYECFAQILHRSAFESKYPEGLESDFKRIKTELSAATTSILSQETLNQWWQFPPTSIEVVFYAEVCGITTFDKLSEFRKVNNYKAQDSSAAKPTTRISPTPINGQTPRPLNKSSGNPQERVTRTGFFLTSSLNSNPTPSPKKPQESYSRGRFPTERVASTTPNRSEVSTPQKPQEPARRLTTSATPKATPRNTPIVVDQKKVTLQSSRAGSQPIRQQPTTTASTPGQKILAKLQVFRKLAMQSAIEIIAIKEKAKVNVEQSKKHYEYLQMFSLLDTKYTVAGTLRDMDEEAVVGLVRCCRTFYEWARVDYHNATGHRHTIPSFQEIIDDPNAAHQQIIKTDHYSAVLVGLLLLVYPLKSLSHRLAISKQFLMCMISAKIYAYGLINSSFLLHVGNTQKNKYLALTAGEDHPSLRKWMDENFNANEARIMAEYLAKYQRRANISDLLPHEEKIAAQRQTATNYLLQFITKANAITDPLHPLRLLADRLTRELREERSVLAVEAKRALGKQVVVAVAELKEDTLKLLRRLTARRGFSMPQNSRLELVRNELPLVPLVSPPYLPVDPGSPNTCVSTAQLYLPNKTHTSNFTKIHIGMHVKTVGSDVVYVGPSLVDDFGFELPGLRASLDVLAHEHWRMLVSNMKNGGDLEITVGPDHPFASKNEFNLFVSCLKGIQNLKFKIDSEDKKLAPNTITHDTQLDAKLQQTEILKMEPPLLAGTEEGDRSTSSSEFVPSLYLAKKLSCDEWATVLSEYENRNRQRDVLIYSAVQRVLSREPTLPRLAKEVLAPKNSPADIWKNYRKLCEAEEWGEDMILCNHRGKVVTGFAPKAEASTDQTAWSEVLVPNFLMQTSLPETIFGFAHVNARPQNQVHSIAKPVQPEDAVAEVDLEAQKNHKKHMQELLEFLQKQEHIRVYRENPKVMTWAQGLMENTSQKVKVDVNKYCNCRELKATRIINRERGELIHLDKILLVATIQVKIHPATGEILETPKEFRAVYNVMPQPFAFNYEFRRPNGSIDHSAFLLYCVELLRFYIKVAIAEDKIIYIPTPAIYFNNNIELQAIFETATYLAATEYHAAKCKGIFVSNMLSKLGGDLKSKLGDMIEEARGNLKCPITVLREVNATHIPLHTNEIMICVMGNTESPGKIHGNGFEQQMTRVTMPDVYTIFNPENNERLKDGKWTDLS